MYDKQIKFRADEEIQRIMIARSNKLEMSYSEYIREAIKFENLNQYLSEIKNFTDELNKHFNEIHRIGINLNQIARYANSEKKITSEMKIELNELLNKLGKIIRELA